MKVSDIDFRKMLEFSPDTGRILLRNDRLLIFRQEAFSSLRKLMIEQLGEQLASGLLSQFGYRSAIGDHKMLMSSYEWDSEQDEMVAGPAMHAWEGIVYVEPGKLEFDRKAGTFYMEGRWLNSYEAEIHLAEFGQSDRSVCHTITGYASGWCTAFLGAPVVATETTCKGKGDPDCRYLLKHASGWGPEADPWKKLLEVSDTSISRELDRQLAVIRAQHQQILELSAPILEIGEGVIGVPLVGVLDDTRTAALTERLLQTITERHVLHVILDLTGIEVVDTSTADRLIRIVKAIGLLGGRAVITGIRPAVARTMVTLDASLSGLSTQRTLRDALRALAQPIR